MVDTYTHLYASSCTYLPGSFCTHSHRHPGTLHSPTSHTAWADPPGRPAAFQVQFAGLLSDVSPPGGTSQPQLSTPDRLSTKLVANSAAGWQGQGVCHWMALEQHGQGEVAEKSLLQCNQRQIAQKPQTKCTELKVARSILYSSCSSRALAQGNTGPACMV